MATVTIDLPALLQPMAQDTGTVTVDARTLGGALDALFAAHPALRVHVLDESGGLREHVLCLHNGANSRWRGSLEEPVTDGDVVTILQAVSGG